MAAENLTATGGACTTGLLRHLGVEYAKLRRLKLGLVLGGGGVAAVLFASMSLFSADYRARINDPATQHWPGMLLFYILVLSLVSPLVMATLASRVAEIEHLGNGWTAAAVSGLPKGRLCLVKLIALAPMALGWIGVQLAALVLASLLCGADGLPPAGQWIQVWLTCAVITLVLLAGHLWLAARVDNQLVGLGVGVLGAFAGGFSMLMPAWLVHLIPWGYYALAAPFRMAEQGYAPVTVPWGSLVGLLTLLAVVIALGYVRLNRQEN